MPNTIIRSSVESLVPPTGMQETPADMASSTLVTSTGMAAFVRNLFAFFTGALGISNSIPPSNPPSVNPVTIGPGPGLSVVVGNSGEGMICQDLPLDNCPATTLSLAAADPTNPRIDLVVVKATLVAGPQSVTRNVRSISATPNPNVVTGTMASGVCTIDLTAYGYPAIPSVL